MKRSFCPQAESLETRELLSEVVFGPPSFAMVASGPILTASGSTIGVLDQAAPPIPQYLIGHVSPINPDSEPIGIVNMTSSYDQSLNVVNVGVMTVGLNNPGSMGTCIVQYQLTDTMNHFTYPASSVSVAVRGLGNTNFALGLPLPGYPPGQYTVTLKAYDVLQPNDVTTITQSIVIDTYVQPSDNAPVIASLVDPPIYGPEV